MKKIIPYLISIVLGIAIAICFFVIWEPLKDRDITKIEIVNKYIT